VVDNETNERRDRALPEPYRAHPDGALERREALGRDTYDLRRQPKALEALLAVHKAARDTVPPRPSSKPLRWSRPRRFMIRSRTRLVKRHPEGEW